MFNWLAGAMFRVLGWKITGSKSYLQTPKCIFMVAPHSFTFDFFLGLGTRPNIGVDVGYLGKAELFKPPFGWFFYWTGGTPVNRHSSNNVVQAVADTFARHEVLRVAVAPEGTRKDITELRSGFYYMAKAAGVPLILTGFDYAKKEIHFSEPYHVSGNYEKDLIDFAHYFNQYPIGRKSWIAKVLDIKK